MANFREELYIYIHVCILYIDTNVIESKFSGSKLTALRSRARIYACIYKQGYGIRRDGGNTFACMSSQRI